MKGANLPNATLTVGIADENWSRDAQYFEYSQAADPIGSGTISPVPAREFPASLYQGGPTRIIPLDLADELHVAYPATSPALLAHYVTIHAGEKVVTHPNATSELYYVIRGAGHTELDGRFLDWRAGDFFVLPGGSTARHVAEMDAALYYVIDQPLLQYLGVKASVPRFEATLFPSEQVRAELRRVAKAPDAHNRNRVSVLLNHANFPETQTVTHTLWAMFGLIEPGTIQMPHRHNSVALDFVVDAKVGTYTLLGSTINPRTQEIIDPIRVDWEPGKAFVTPPGMWHAHYNESRETAYILPVQDAGLQTYLRTLDIQFTSSNKARG